MPRGLKQTPLVVSLALSICALAILGGPASGQSGRRPQAQGTGVSGSSASDSKSDDQVELEIGTQEVLLSITVRDFEGRPVTNLKPEEFIIAEDRARQTIASFSTEEVPVNVLLLLDASGSVFSERTAIRKAAAAFADALGPEDRVSVIQFADKVELLQDWTSDREEIQLALDWRYRGGEQTDLWDALFLGATEQLAKVDGRRAIILLTDGVDTTSEVNYAQTLAALDRADTTVYVISTAQAVIDRYKPYAGFGGKIAGTAAPASQAIARLREAEERMRQLADRYGGRLFSPTNDGDLSDVYAQVAEELRRQYVVTYVSTNERRDGRWRAIEVFLSRPGMTARTRRGYIVE